MDRCVVMNEGCATSDDVNATPLQEKEKENISTIYEDDHKEEFNPNPHTYLVPMCALGQVMLDFL